ncbi:hypothetical protein SNEBB_004347 [Seison nebaliae]|nr:hypothetical protein SNEBB_004347 [Seison nebaliae]
MHQIFQDFNSMAMPPVFIGLKPVSMTAIGRNEQMKFGGKVNLPASILDRLTRMSVQYPMLFKLEAIDTKLVTHCGVFEFTAEEGTVVVPDWILNNLGVMLNGINVSYISLPQGTFVRFEPETPDFFEIHDYFAVLEMKLRAQACLTQDDRIAMEYNGKIYFMKVVECKPQRAISIVETDISVDIHNKFLVESPNTQKNKYFNIKPKDDDINMAIHGKNQSTFAGTGTRLDGKPKKVKKVDMEKEEERDQIINHSVKRGIPNYDYPLGNIRFIHERPVNESELNTNKDFSAFTGPAKHFTLTMDNHVKSSMTLTWLLRHGAIEEKLRSYGDGYFSVKDVLNHPQIRKHRISYDELKTMVETSPKQRYKMIRGTNGEELIRANQGHSMKEIDINFKELHLEDLHRFINIHHGTYKSFLDSIQKNGLHKMRRNHIHMTYENKPSAVPRKCDTFIFIDVASAMNDGYKFYLADNGAILTPGNREGYLPCKYFEKIKFRT